MRNWERKRGIEHDPSFWFGSLGYWWTRNMTGETGTGMVIESVKDHVECEKTVGLPGGCSEGSWM